MIILLIVFLRRIDQNCRNFFFQAFAKLHRIPVSSLCTALNQNFSRVFILGNEFKYIYTSTFKCFAQTLPGFIKQTKKSVYIDL